MEENKSISNLKLVEEEEAGGILFKIGGDKIFFLVIHRDKQNDWSLPKGHLEDGETLEGCAIREIAEETGWCGEIIARVGVMNYTHHNRKKNIMRDVLVNFFLIKPTKEDASLFVEKDHSHKWIAYGDELFNTLTYPAEKPVLKKAYNYLKNHGNPAKKS